MRPVPINCRLRGSELVKRAEACEQVLLFINLALLFWGEEKRGGGGLTPPSNCQIMQAQKGQKDALLSSRQD